MEAGKENRDISAQNEESEESSIITLTDSRGRKVRFELLDMINYSGTDYAVMVPAEEGEDADQVLIFRVEDAEKDVNTLTLVDNPETAQAIFELFRTKNANRFDFD